MQNSITQNSGVYVHPVAPVCRRPW